MPHKLFRLGALLTALALALTACAPGASSSDTICRRPFEPPVGRSLLRA